MYIRVSENIAVQNITLLHLKCTATLPYEIVMSEPAWLEHQSTVSLKDALARDLMYGRQQLLSLVTETSHYIIGSIHQPCHWNQWFSNWCMVVNFSTLTVTTSDCLTWLTHVQRSFVPMSLLQQMHTLYSHSFCEIFSVTNANTFYYGCYWTKWRQYHSTTVLSSWVDCASQIYKRKWLVIFWYDSRLAIWHVEWRICGWSSWLSTSTSTTSHVLQCEHIWSAFSPCNFWKLIFHKAV